MSSSPRSIMHYLPTMGCCLFLVFISIASLQYPGGTLADTSTVGYSWQQNYLCDVINTVAQNNLPHDYHRIGLAAMICLCGSISMFFFLFTDWMNVTGIWKIIIRWMGFVSMICAMMIFTDLHNTMIAVASILALPALVGVFVILYRKREIKFIWMGVFIALLLFMNNFIYYTDMGIVALPQLQKITCLILIAWLVKMNLTFTKKLR